MPLSHPQPTTLDRIGHLALTDLAALAAQVTGAAAAVLVVDDEAGPGRAVHAVSPAVEASARHLLEMDRADLDREAQRSDGHLHVVPLESLSGQGCGTLAVTCVPPRSLSPDQRLGLARVARQAVTLVEQARVADERANQHGRHEDSRLAFEATERQMRRFAGVVEALPQVVALADLDGRVLYMNHAARHAWPWFEAASTTLADLHSPDGRAIFEAGAREALVFGAWRGDNTLTDAQGVWSMVSQTLLIVRDRKGSADCLAMICDDVTAQRRQHEHVLQSEQRFRHLVDDLEDVLFEQDTDGRFTFLNAAWESMLGYRPEDSVGQICFDYLHPEDVPAMRARLEQMLAGTIPAAAQSSRYRTNAGTWRWLEGRVRRITGDDGRPLGVVGTLRDVTARRAMADEIARAHEQALRSTSQMSEFLANMSHEIRTPLNGVMGLTSILLDTALSEEQRSLTDNLKRSAETLLNLVNDILDISKIESGNLTIERVPFDLATWAGDATAPGFAKAKRKGLDVFLAIDDELPARIVGDPTRTRQILTNLVDNAVKFTAKGRVSVGLAAHKVADGRTMLRVAVTDSGIGIPEDKVTLVFEKYRQADSSTTRQYGGTGLGLAICRQLAAWMDGDSGVESEVGTGSTFWFTIPLMAADATAALHTESVRVDTAEIAKARLRVLVVDDSTTNQFVARKFLEKLGCIVETADNGEDAVGRVQDGGLDAVFMDCQMPIMDGYEATARIRQMHGCEALPVVAMTAHAMTGDRERCLAAGMTDYVSKPLRPEALAAVMQRLIAERGGVPA